MKSNALKILAALLAGLMSNLAFEPAGVYPVIFVTLAVLFWIWCRADARTCAWSGFAFGLGFFGFGIHWIYNSLYLFGAAAPPLAAFMVLALVSTLSLLIAVGGYLQARIATTPNLRCLALIPSVWVLVEWLRSWFLSGFAWLYLGYSQTDNWLAGWAPLGGVYAVSLVICVITGAVVLCVLKGVRMKPIVVVTVLVAIGFWGKSMNWTTASHAPIDVAIIQGDISIWDKWNARKARLNLNYFVEESQKLDESDLVIWPEIAVSQTDKRLEKLRMWRLLMSYPPQFLIGVIEEYDQESNLHYNSAYGITDAIEKYRKHRLVPFGEFTPFRSLLGWLDAFIEIPQSDFGSYSGEQQPLMLAGQPAGVSICYEDSFPQEILRMLPESTYLINLSEDAWFGSRIAPFQRIQMSRMRAMETARPVLRAANKGISASIDHRGNIVDQLAQTEGKVLRTQVTPKSGATPFVRFGTLPLLILCAVLLALSVLHGPLTARKR